MWELEVCGPLVVNGDGGRREIESFMSASNTAERVAEDSSRDRILYGSRLPPSGLETGYTRTYHRGELKIRFNLKTSILGYQCPLLLP